MSSDVPGESETSTLRLGIIVIAAGRGTRMNSSLNKVLHPLLGIPMISHVIHTAMALSPAEIVVVAGADASRIEAQLPPPVAVVVQEHPLGTADAVAAGIEAISMHVTDILILSGDVPLVTTDSLRALVDTHRATRPLLTLASFEAAATSRYGRVARRESRISGVVEASDDDRGELESIEANGGIYVFEAGWLRENVGKVRVSASGEYYLTSLVGAAARAKLGDQAPVGTVSFDYRELLGVDDRLRLADAEDILRRRVLERLMRSGVTIVDPDRTIVETGVSVERDARIEPGSILRGSTSVGRGAIIGPYSILEDAIVGDDSIVLHSWITGTAIGSNVRIGPYSHMRPGTAIADDVHIGNYVETKAAEIGSGTHIGHFSYVGDASLGTNVNVGAGTITCNYDGVRKHRTIIGNDVFVGCDTMFVAPVEIGEGSRTGAGAVVTKSVPPGKTVVGVPARQIGTSRPSQARLEDGDNGR